MRTDNLEQRVRELAAEATSRAAIELVHVEIDSVKNKRVLRIYIDKEGGVTHDDCSKVSRQIEELFERDDPIESGYVLEVSSPGIERGLYSLEDFKRFAGENARLKTQKPVDDRKSFRGRIAGVDGETIEIEEAGGKMIRISYDLIKRANLTFDFEKELKESRQQKRKGRGR